MHNGHNLPRKIRYLNLLGKKCYLVVPSLRLVCSHC
ncbi:transposase family protein [Paenibacillus amylolyticus]